jgi:hypothetical protein
MELTVARLYVLRALDGAGWPAELIGHALTRAGAAETDLQALRDEALVEIGTGPYAGRYVLTPLGRQVYRREKRHRGHRF